MPEVIIKSFMKQLLKTIAFLHDKNFIHRDIKLENICLNNRHEVVLIDFDFCIYDSDRKKGEGAFY